MGNVSFHGNIGKVKELQFGQDGKARFSFSVAESHSRFNKQTNQWEDTGTTWRNVTMFGKRAEHAAEVIQAGAKQKVLVTGREETRDYESNGETRQSFDCIADVVGIIPTGQGGTHSHPNQAQAQGNFANNLGAQNVTPQPNGGGQWAGQPAADPWGPAQPQGNGGGWGNPGNDKPPF